MSILTQIHHQTFLLEGALSMTNFSSNIPPDYLDLSAKHTQKKIKSTFHRHILILIYFISLYLIYYS